MASKKRKPKKPRAVRAWAWTIQNGRGEWSLCFWAEPTKKLLQRSKPSPEAKAVRVRIEVEP